MSARPLPEPDHGRGGADDRGAGDLRFSPRPNRAVEIAWRTWGERAFAEARASGKPVLLSISAVWCHWCHVMDETSYSDRQVIDTINEAFIPIRVDNDRRPDVNKRYNMGGWPTTAFLSAHGDVLTGATYLPPGQMLEALRRVADFYRANGAELLEMERDMPIDPGLTPARHPTGKARGKLEELAERGTGAAADGAPADSLGPEQLERIVGAIVRAFDPVHGGLGAEPKFPQPDAFALLAAYVGRGAAFGGEYERARAALETTLDRMPGGEIWDAVEGGFFRYATRRDWSVPHFEKMLEDNARLALLYFDGADLADEAGSAQAATRWRATAAAIVDYLLRSLWLPDEPAFGGTQDADEQYYALDEDARLLETPPAVDPTVYVDWNALAVRTLLRASGELERPELAERALAVLDHLWDDGHGRRGMVHFLRGPVDALLGDQIHMMAALLDAYEVTGKRPYLARAEVLADWVGEHLGARNGRLIDHPVGGDLPGLLAEPVAAVDENGLAADTLLRLALDGGQARFGSQAARLLGAWVGDRFATSLGAGAYGLGLLRYLAPGPHVAIVGPPDDETVCALRRATLRAAAPQRTIQHLDPAADVEQIVRGGYAVSGPAAYVCAAAVCQPPTADPDELGRLVCSRAAPAPPA